MGKLLDLAFDFLRKPSVFLADIVFISLEDQLTEIQFDFLEEFRLHVDEIIEADDGIAIKELVFDLFIEVWKEGFELLLQEIHICGDLFLDALQTLCQELQFLQKNLLIQNPVLSSLTVLSLLIHDVGGHTCLLLYLHL